jgi:BirA family biotin operon repressor/biotin-[acetyl-CoA-carboxylase] ligase
MTTKSQVLTLLMQHTSTFLSGEEMAGQLGISRTAIWKAINELKKEGHLITSVRNKGYQLDKSDVLSAEGIRLGLKAVVPDLTIQILPSSDSTMKDIKLAALDNAPENTLIIANMQTTPKGRFGRPFFAKAGKGIYMSLLLRPNQNFEEMAQYTIIMAVAVARALELTANVSAEIKWVNDIYVRGKKVCGILSEAMSDVESGQISNVMIGMGINFSIEQTEFPEELQTQVTSLFPSGNPTITRNEVIAAIWNQFYQILAELPQQDFLEEYRERSFVLGKEVAFTQAGVAYHGRALTINAHGELVVELTNGEQKILTSGEISLDQIGHWKRA